MPSEGDNPALGGKVDSVATDIYPWTILDKARARLPCSDSTTEVGEPKDNFEVSKSGSN
jgi:hypothetical protein